MAQYGTFQWNTMMYNGSPLGATVYSSDLVVFDSFSLADNVNTFCANIIDSGPKRDLIDGPTPRADGQYLIADYWRQKDVEVTGVVKAADAASLNAYLDTMRKGLRKRAANLDLTRNGVVRRFVATLTNAEQLFAARQPWNITVCPFKAVFTCETPFGTDRDYSNTSQSITSSPTTLTAENLGTIKTQPVVLLVFDAASSVTVVDLTNATTGEEIKYTGSCAANDVLVFDSEMKTVTKNGTAVDYAGSFPTLDAGSNNVKFTVTATSFTAQATVKWKNAYL